MTPALLRLPVICYILIAATVAVGFVMMPFDLFLPGGLYPLVFVAAHLLGLFYLYMTGRLRKSPLRIAFMLFIPLYAIGALMKLQHWAMGAWFIPAVLLGMTLLYTFWTLRKSSRTALDLLKLLFLLFCAIRSWLVFSHTIPRNEQIFLEFPSLAFLALLVYLNDRQIRRSIRAAEIDAFYNELN